MPKLRLLALAAALYSSSALAAVPPSERLEGQGIAEDDARFTDANYYLSDDNPFAPASDGDEDLGEQVILRRQSKRSPLRVRADTFLFWSSNVGSVAVNEEDGWFFGGSLSARWNQRLSPTWSLDTYAYQDAYLYDTEGLDFQSSEIGVGLIGNIAALDDLTVYGRYEFLYVHSENPLVGILNPDEHFNNRYHRLRVGAFKELYAKPSHLVTLSANGSWDFDASAGTSRRQQASARLAYTWNATPRMRATTYYRASFRDYLASEREDWNQYLGLELNYTLTDWAELYGSILYGVNESNDPSGDRDYEALQGGLGIGVRASF